MKKLIIYIVIYFFSTNFLFAEDKCKKVGILQIEKSKECLKQNKSDKDPKKKGKSLDALKSGTKKVLNKLNTDSKLTDYIKKKLPK